MEHETIKNLLKKRDLEPNKVLGQNFITDQNAVRVLIDAAEVADEDMVLEVGPGTGTITKELAKRAKQVIAIEKDPNMVRILQEELKNHDNVTVINEDILKFRIEDLELFQNSKFKIQNSDYKVIGAPPYYLTARLFRKFLEEAEIKPQTVAVIIQKEVAQKICAKPPDMTLLAISVQLYGNCTIAKEISKNKFWPKPKVDSAILVVNNIQKPDIDENTFFKVVRAGFSAPRKQLAGNLSRELSINKEKIEKTLKNSDIDPQRRAQTLSIKEWRELTQKF